MGSESTSPSPRHQAGSVPLLHGAEGQPAHRGRHICQIYTHDEERMDAVLEFIRTGLQSGDQTYCIAEKPASEILDGFLADSGISLSGARGSGQFHSGVNHDFYLHDGGFDLRRILAQWDAIYAEARIKAAPGIMVVADVLTDLRYLKNGTQLVIYESKLEQWMNYHQATIVCQYDARSFDGCTIVDMLKVHPLVLANGRVAASPFFAYPDRMKSH
jgi:hypothetical protein